MNKLLVILLMLFVSSQSSGQMEEIGYNTTDVGAEFQWYKGGKFIGLHVAVNAKLHHSIHGEIGYYFAGDPTAAFYYNQNKGGAGFGIGYRYYTMLRPHAFFIGVKANIFSNKVTLTTQTPETVNSAIVVPSFEAGYMILINDLFFITPSAAIGYKTNLRSELKADEKKAVGMLGISMGFKF
jgi:hypothetical protein